MHKHLLKIKGLTKEDILSLVSSSEEFVEIGNRRVKKVPALRGKTVINLFLEPSTRTRTSFEIAGKRLSADVINISASQSSTTKGETLMDTALTLQAMNPDVVVIRHASSGAASFIAKHLKYTSVINAGDGLHEHPTQAILDALTIKQRLGRLDNLILTLVGDSFRSRVARSNIHLHLALGNEVRLVGPPSLAMREFEAMGAKVFKDMEPALEGSDVVMSLRMKHEYLKDLYIPSLDEYTRKYFISEKVLSENCNDCIVLAPGPFIRGVEISTEVADGPRSCINNQVNNGVAVRMAVLFKYAFDSEDSEVLIEG